MKNTLNKIKTGAMVFINSRPIGINLSIITFLSLLLIVNLKATAQTQIIADFSKRTGPPLIKTKFNVYQTPLAPLQRMLNDQHLLKESGIRSLRFETAWGKSIDFNAPSITGTYPDFKYNRTGYTQFIKGLEAQLVYPLLTLTYTPDPLKLGKDWRDKPSSLEGYEKVTRDFAAYWKSQQIMPIDYEVWNEPDFKVFFSGGKTDYFDIYKAGAQGIKAGNKDAKVGGPVTAFNGWYKDFLSFVKNNNLPLDFLSGHAYSNAGGQLQAMKSALGTFDWPGVETYLTEYASYKSVPGTDIREGGASERYIAAADFFKDAKMFLEHTELTKVYWAQWSDVELLSKEGNWYYEPKTDKMGLIDLSGKPKALFNGFKIYNLMPVDRNEAIINNPNVDALASSDAHNAGFVVWNLSDSATTITTALKKLPFKNGSVKIYRIDATHSSYFENKNNYNLVPLEIKKLSADQFSWTGKLPAKAVVFIQLKDNSGQSELKTNLVAKDIRTYHWFWDRGNTNYADFDRQTWIARLGMGSSKDTATAQIGVELTYVPQKLRIVAKTSGTPHIINDKSVLGYRLDFMDTNGNYVKSVLFHGTVYHNYHEKLSWGKKNIADINLAIRVNDHTLNLKKLTPANFNGKILLTFILQNTGKNSSVTFKVYKASDIKLLGPLLN